MASPAQINANRANAQKSTGPRSAEGKSASSPATTATSALEALRRVADGAK